MQIGYDINKVGLQKSFFQRYFPYIQDWKTKFLVLSIFVVFVLFILLFLEPFKTDESSKLRVGGYCLCILLSYALGLVVESFLFGKQQTWRIQQEIIFVAIVIVSTSLSVYWYDLVVIKSQPFHWGQFGHFFTRIILPFSILLIPVMVALRRYFGNIVEIPDEHLVHIEGKSANEKLVVDSRLIYYITSSNNYVDIFYSVDEDIKNTLIRTTLSNVMQLIPSLVQCHRSYVINPIYLESLVGNQKKAVVRLKGIEEDIPVSKSYYSTIKNLANSPQKGGI